MITIYLITNKVNGKTYVGSTKDYIKRQNQHFYSLNSGKHHNVYLQRTFNKYGNVFEFSILEDNITTDQQFIKEELWANELKPEYNLGSFGGGDNLTNHPDRLDIIKRIRETLLANISSMTKEERQLKWGKTGSDNPNWRGGISKSFCVCGTEKALTANTCATCRDISGKNNPFYGKKHSEGTKKLLSNLMKERVKNGFVPANAKVVITPIAEFVSLTSASRAHNITAGAMHYRVNSKSIKWEDFYYKTPND